LTVRVALEPISANTTMTGAKLTLDKAEFSTPP